MQKMKSKEELRNDLVFAREVLKILEGQREQIQQQVRMEESEISLLEKFLSEQTSPSPCPCA